MLLMSDIIKKPCRSMVQKCALKIKIMANSINNAKSCSHSFVNIILIIIRDINSATGKCIFLR
ncbi:hypothetical protein B9086_015280 [Morganella morganii subsp. morganii]|uniref:Uncharacterized protein n=1 Tax=Morganella morganii TaxID=582 RepID=A0A2C5TGH9_MORMO|nr:hypothetical protein AL531_01720 [Morganella morganii]EMP51601.1 hypothetical protein C790_00996 [Morganella morganii SC01]RNW09922.1 hypothetical protein B9086_015280 [Morganella morganii subsp. morganii]AVK37050.1 hypothetical protein CSB69_1972 [Morganella morganii]MBE8614033.1 hypothetical protein [Morganella morganii]